MLKVYNYPRSLKKSERYSAKVWTVANPQEQQDLPVFWTKVGDFVSFEFDEPVVLEFTIHREKALDPNNLAVRPLIHGIKAEVEDRTFRFEMKEARNLKVDPAGIAGEVDLFIYANKPEDPKDIPDANAENVIYYPAGQTYEVAQMEISSDTIIYIEGGAVVKGVLHAAKQNNIKVMGRGVIDGSYFTRGIDRPRHTVQFEQCNDIEVKDVTIIHPMIWTLVLGGCDGVHIDNVRELGFEGSSDGIDICGSRNVLIENCCIKVNDDCVVIKSFAKPNLGTIAWNHNVENILVRNCILGTENNGAIMEIGHEFACDSVNNVRFENIDVLGQHGFGSVFSIQNCDKATISNVTWDNIRIEHCYAGVINFRIMKSMYSIADVRGHVDGITIKNVDWHASIFNIGYTASRIGGYSKDHMIKNVSIENFKINGKPIESLDELYIFTSYVENLELKK